MSNTTERAFVSDSETWEVFIGGITPKEFCKGFLNADSAIDDFLNNYPYNEEIPSWLRGSLIECIESAIKQEKSELTEEFDSIDWFTATIEVCSPEMHKEYNFSQSVSNPYV